MAEVKLSVDGASTKEEVVSAIEEEIKKFSAFMGNINDPMAKGPLAQWEETILRTYLIHKFRGRIEGGS